MNTSPVLKPIAKTVYREMVARLSQPFICAAIITLIQIGLMVSASPGQSFATAYSSCRHMDNYWYASIVDRGYVSTVPPVPQNPERSNVGFFPGFPLAAKAIKFLSHLSTLQAMVMTAQLATFLFWTYVFAFLRRWRFSTVPAIIAALVIMSHPDAFHFVIGYSESLFMAMLLGFLFWLERPGSIAALLAGAHGFGLTATRLVGVLCALWPLARSVLTTEPFSQTGPRPFQTARALAPKAMLTTGFASLGAILFLAFCQWKFGCWNLYMQTQRVGWGQRANYAAFFHPSSYDFTLPDPQNFVAVGHFLMSTDLVLLLLLLVMEVLFRKQLLPTLSSRLGFYVCGWSIFYLSMAGTHDTGMRGALRYDLCIHVLILLSAASLIKQLVDAFKVRWWVYLYALGLGVGGAISSLMLQFFYTQNWLAGFWR